MVYYRFNQLNITHYGVVLPTPTPTPTRTMLSTKPTQLTGNQSLTYTGEGNLISVIANDKTNIFYEKYTNGDYKIIVKRADDNPMKLYFRITNNYDTEELIYTQDYTGTSFPETNWTILQFGQTITGNEYLFHNILLHPNNDWPEEDTPTPIASAFNCCNDISIQVNQDLYGVSFQIEAPDFQGLTLCFKPKNGAVHDGENLVYFLANDQNQLMALINIISANGIRDYTDSTTDAESIFYIKTQNGDCYRGDLTTGIPDDQNNPVIFHKIN